MHQPQGPYLFQQVVVHYFFLSCSTQHSVDCCALQGIHPALRLSAGPGGSLADSGALVAIGAQVTAAAGRHSPAGHHHIRG